MNLETDLIIHLIARIREKANRFIIAELKSHHIEDLIPVHGDILFALFKYGQIPMKTIAQIVDRKKSTVTTLVDKLIHLGYVQKKADETDHRYALISLTKKGQQLAFQLQDISDKLLNKVYKDMPVEERIHLVKNLRMINDNW